MSQKQKRECCVVCSGTGKLTARQLEWLRYYLNLASAVEEMRKKVAPAQSEALGTSALNEALACMFEEMESPAKTTGDLSLTKYDRKFLSGLNITLE